jgi:hypothetical protein
MNADQMQAIDQAMGIVEVCTVCGNEHFAKSPICGDCAFAQWVDGQEEREHPQEEPLSYEAMEA